ncbi:hypothetical protein BH11MYX1_BH11MYX1_31710 [soil metagenome]
MKRLVPATVIALLVATGIAYELTRSDPVVVAPVPPVLAKPTISMPAFIPDAGASSRTFVGSAGCSDCHDKEAKGWRKSWHARALSPATDPFVVGDFANARFTGASSTATMPRHGQARTMRTAGPDGTTAVFPVNWVIGGKRMQDAVTVFPDGRWQVLPVYFHVRGGTWVDFTEAKQGVLTPEHPFWWTNARRMANHECLDCHTTNLRVENANGTWTTQAADFTVACESCHGPGSTHADSSKKEDIAKPSPKNITACARCHGPRQPLWPLLDADHAFELRRDYDEAYDPIVITLPGGGTSSDFFADGRPATSSFEYQAMLQSACYRRGGATCLTCHAAPHAPGAKHAELRDEPNKLCASCHHDLAADHAHHKTATCIDCHMPPVVAGVRDNFADHSIDVQNPNTTARHAVPNACGVCHAQTSPAELEADIIRWWPAAGARSARRERLADAFDEATAATSGPALRAVVADPAEAPTLRGAAAITLGRRAHAAAVPELMPLLASELTVLRAKGCEALGDARAKSAGDAVAAKLADPSLRVRLACSLALFDMHDPRGDLALARLARDPATAHLMIPHLELGNAAMRRGDFATGKRELEQVTLLAPYFTDAATELAAAYAELGDLAEARKRVAAVLQLEPNHRAAKELQRKLH